MTIYVVTYDSREMARRGRLGALALHSRYDPLQTTAKARATYIGSFVDHSSCGFCGNPAPIPADLPPEVRAQRGEYLRVAHYLRLSQRSKVLRAQRKAAVDGDARCSA